MNGTLRRTLVSPWRMYCTYCGIPKGTSQAEATSNSEKIKPVALAIIELCWSEGIRQLVSKSVSPSVNRKFRGNFLKAFHVNLKACLHCRLGKWGWFSGDFTSWATPTSLLFLLWTTIVVHDKGAFAHAQIIGPPTRITWNVYKTPPILAAWNNPDRLSWQL